MWKKRVAKEILLSAFGVFLFVLWMLIPIKVTQPIQKVQNTSNVSLALPIIHGPIPSCAARIFETTASLVKKSWHPGLVIVVAINDILCEETEHTANLGLYTASPSDHYFFTIVHAHFLSDGTLISPLSVPRNQWTEIKHSNGWRHEWCEFIRLSYKNEYSLWDCPSIQD